MNNEQTPQMKVTGNNSEPQSVLGVMQGIDERVRSGEMASFLPISTGFEELDAAIGGGFRPGQLVLLSGPAGVGKTSLTLQMARNIALSKQATCLFVCYEHEADYLSQRLISMESVSTTGNNLYDGLRMRDIADLVVRYKSKKDGHTGFLDAIKSDPRGERALNRVNMYGQDLLLVKGSSYKTTVEELADMVRQVKSASALSGSGDRPLVLFVDYLQKIAASTPHTDEIARNIEEVEGLKELTLDQQIIVVAIVAAEVEGLKVQRLRLQHLLASAAIAYEADLIMLMNEKYDIIDRRHVDYNRHHAEQFHHYVILSVEKNRAGSDLIDLELRKQLQFCHFRPDARRVEEQLIRSRTVEPIG